MSLKVRMAAAGLSAAVLISGSASAQTGGPPMSGAKLFEQNCSACHQVTGLGIPGAFPALAGNAFVQGPAEPVAATVLNGRGGMPSFRTELSRQEIADILTYVRSAWGNKAPPMELATVSGAPGGKAAAPEEAPVLGFH